MQISDRALELVKDIEGYHRKLDPKNPRSDCTTYICPAGKLTIGFGCTEGIREGEVWTYAQAEERLRLEMRKHEIGVENALAVSVNQNQFDALCLFSYNVGIAGMSSSSVVRYLNKGDVERAAQSFALWNKHKNPKTKELEVSPGLVNRRAREAALFLEPVAEEEAPAMPQAVEPPPEPSEREWHAEAHETLKSASAWYNLNRWTVKGLATTLSPAFVFARDNAFEIAVGVTIFIVVLLGFQFAKREGLLREIKP